MVQTMLLAGMLFFPGGVPPAWFEASADTQGSKRFGWRVLVFRSLGRCMVRSSSSAVWP